MIASVRFGDIETQEALRERRGSEFFNIKNIPQIGSKLVYYKFNGDKHFQAEPVVYTVIDVVYEIQEDYNGMFEERVTVMLMKKTSLESIDKSNK